MRYRSKKENAIQIITKHIQYLLQLAKSYLSSQTKQ